ncbi:hypothetical protein ACHAWF_012887, partial [Thalassiosira exigua]
MRNRRGNNFKTKIYICEYKIVTSSVFHRRLGGVEHAVELVPQQSNPREDHREVMPPVALRRRAARLQPVVVEDGDVEILVSLPRLLHEAEQAHVQHPSAPLVDDPVAAEVPDVLVRHGLRVGVLLAVGRDAVVQGLDVPREVQLVPLLPLSDVAAVAHEVGGLEQQHLGPGLLGHPYQLLEARLVLQPRPDGVVVVEVAPVLEVEEVEADVGEDHARSEVDDGSTERRVVQLGSLVDARVHDLRGGVAVAVAVVVVAFHRQHVALHVAPDVHGVVLQRADPAVEPRLVVVLLPHRQDERVPLQHELDDEVQVDVEPHEGGIPHHGEAIAHEGSADQVLVEAAQLELAQVAQHRRRAEAVLDHVGLHDRREGVDDLVGARGGVARRAELGRLGVGEGGRSREGGRPEPARGEEEGRGGTVGGGEGRDCRHGRQAG